jgi:hypothetical protein
MHTISFRHAWGRATAGCLLGLVLMAWPSAADAQSFLASDSDGMVPRDFGLGSYLPGNAPASPAANRSRIRLFRFTPGFMTDPVGLQDVDDAPPGTFSTTPVLPPESENGPDWIQVAVGTDNPYFDFRQPGDPGGVGFYRVNTQLQLIDTTTTACSLGVQAVSPAGIQYNGVPDGPTVFSPHFGLFHALDEDTALQCFVRKHLCVSNTGTGSTVQRDLQYGMAVQRSLATIGPESLRNIYLYMGALGQVRPERNEQSGALATWRMLPGVYWQLADNWWMSGGFLLPVGPARSDSSVNLPWQLTCSFQF